MNKTTLIFLTSFGLLLLAWDVATYSGFISNLFLPTPKEFADAVSRLATDQGFRKDIGASVYRVVIAFLLSALIAIPLAILMCSFAAVGRLFSPYIDFIRYLPVPALIPVTILFFGIDESAKIALLFIGTFFQLILLIIDDIQDIPGEYSDLTFSLRFTKWQEMKFMFMSILPQIYDNSRITIGWCWTYVIIAELVASENGIGHMIKEAQRLSNVPNMYVGIVTMGLIGFGSDLLFKKLYPVFFPYKRKAALGAQ